MVVCAAHSAIALEGHSAGRIPVAAYLTTKDKVALDDGIWTIAEDSSTGAKIGGVPIEEAIFFLLTSWVSAQGIILLSDERSPSILNGLRKRLLRLLRRRRPARKGL
jgi:hypothetical protein